MAAKVPAVPGAFGASPDPKPKARKQMGLCRMRLAGIGFRFPSSGSSTTGKMLITQSGHVVNGTVFFQPQSHLLFN